MKAYLAILFALFVFSIQALQIYGQIACLPVNYQDLPYWQANSVFIGTVEKLSTEENSVPETQAVIISDSPKNLKNFVVKFTVEKNYRGVSEKFIEINTNSYFKQGERYFVYAVRGTDGKLYKLNDGICGKPAISLKDAAEDIEYADEIASGKSGTRIFGFVYQDKQELLETPRQNIPLPGIEVTIKNKKAVFTTKTDASGKYVFKNIPTGEYKITALAPEGLREKESAPNRIFRNSKPNTVFVGQNFETNNFIREGFTEKPKPVFYHSDSYNFVFTSLSSIEGKVIDSNGKIATQQFLWLLSVDEKGKSKLDEPVRYLWIDKSSGEFVFDGIPKGKYRIAINRYNCHADRNPEYGRTFFPGASRETESEMIKVGENQTIKLKGFRLPAPLAERSFSGTVLSADKTPLADAAVFIMNRDSINAGECFSKISEVKTDEFGRFTIKGYETYQYRIRAYTQSTEPGSPRLISKILEIPASGNLENIELIADTNY